MAYIGIGYSGEDAAFLRSCAQECAAWLEGERLPHFFGDRFVVLYDSNSAREFCALCTRRAGGVGVSVYLIDSIIEPMPGYKQ